jgi:hypothetical protein
VEKRGGRVPKNYDGTRTTSRLVSSLLTHAMHSIATACSDRPDLILAAWPELIGPKLAPMTQAISCCNGVLTVNVKNSTLHSLLSRHEKYRLLEAMRQRFPKAQIQNIVFRIG